MGECPKHHARYAVFEVAHQVPIPMVYDGLEFEQTLTMPLRTGPRAKYAEARNGIDLKMSDTF